MRRNRRTIGIRAQAAVLLVALLATSVLALIGAPVAAAQGVNEVARALEQDGYYIEPGAEGSDAGFESLVRQGDRTQERWYFVSMADTVSDDFAADLRGALSADANVLVYFLADGFANVQLSTQYSEAIEDEALAPFDTDWVEPEDFMSEVITELTAVTASANSGSSSSGSSGSASSGSTDSGSSSSGGGFPWAIVLIPLVLLGGFLWFSSRRNKKKKDEAELDAAQKIRAEIQTELDELANDVIVLSGPIDLSNKPEAVNYYREASNTYIAISDEVPDPDKLEDANLRELSELGARVAHARWQMDAAEALMDGEPLPEKPQVAPPPPPPASSQPPAPRQRRQMPQRQPRPRVPYSRSRRSSGGGLLDILIAGAGMMGSSRGRRGGGMFGGGSRNSRSSRGGGMFGGGSSSGRRQSQPAPRRGGGVFGSGSGRRSSSRGSNNRRSTTSRSSNRSTSRRTRSRSTSTRRTTSRRRPRR